MELLGGWRVSSQLMYTNKVSHLNSKEQEQLFASLEKFHEVFSGKLGTCNILNHEIKIPTCKMGVKHIIGFFSYFRNFIPDVANTSHVITELTKKA